MLLIPAPLYGPAFSGRWQVIICHHHDFLKAPDLVTQAGGQNDDAYRLP
jgi:hypothetical protein